MKVLVTGGAGFVGSHVVDHLIEQGAEVRVIDSLHPSAHGAPPSYLRRDVEVIIGDVKDPQVVERAVAGVDAVSHQAAMVGIGESFADAPQYVGDNALGTAVLLAALYRTGFEGRFVLASSMVIYGEGRYECRLHGTVVPAPRPLERLKAGMFEPLCPACGRDLQPRAVSEDQPADPRSVYAATKLQQEHLCFTFGRECDVPVIALRYHNVYGPRMPQNTPYAGVASIFRSALERDDAPEVFEDGRQIRDFVHVADVARANGLALDADISISGAFNIASGEPRSIGEMARLLSDRFGGRDPRVTGRFRGGDVRHVFASPERAASRLGFEARTPFADGIAEFASTELRVPLRPAGDRIPTM